MGCGGSTGVDGKIQMKTTKLAGIDEFFNDVQGFVDEVYEVQDPMEEALDKLLENTGFDTIEGATAHHCAVGIVFSIAASTNGQSVEDIVTITEESPFISIDTSNATASTESAVENFKEYINSIVAAKDRIEPLIEKSKEFAEKAPDLPGKVTGEISNAGGLGAMDKIRAVRYTAANVRNTAKLPGLVNDFKDTVTEALKSVQGATKELNAKKGKLADIGAKCNKNNLESPVD